MARYNNNGVEVTNPIVYCETGRYAATFDITELPNQLIKTGNVKIDIYPCQDFRIMAAKDDDCNIDIYIHANPKRLIRNIPKMIREIASLA